MPLGEWLLTTSEVESRQIVDYCKSLAHDLMKDHEKRFADRIRVIRDAAGSLANAAARFESGVKNAWGTMDKAATDYGSRLAQAIQQTAQRLGRSEPEPKFRETEKFHKESVAALNEIVLTVRKYIPKLHKGLKTEMAALNTALARLEVSVRGLGEALDDSPGAKIESLQHDAERLLRKQEELIAARTQETQQAFSLGKASEHWQGLLRTREELTSKGEFIELRRYEQLLRSKEEEIRQFFQPVAKSLVKLEREAAAKRISSIDVNTLQGLVENPVEALTIAQPYAITGVMDQLDEALSNRRLDIEERKRRKARDTIQEIRAGALNAFRDDYLTIKANIQETLRLLRANGLLGKRDEIERLLTLAERERENLEARHKDLQRKIEDTERELLKQKKAIELQVTKMARREMTIVTF